MNTGETVDSLLAEYGYVQQLPGATKRGLCVFIQSSVLVALVLQRVLQVLQQGPWWRALWERKLPQDAVRQVMEEVASYVLFETTKQLWNYAPGGKPTKDGIEVLNAVLFWFNVAYRIPIETKMQEYQDFEETEDDPLFLVSREVVRATGDKGLRIRVEIFQVIASQIEALIDGVERMQVLSDEEMTGIIQDFFANTWPQMTKPV